MKRRRTPELMDDPRIDAAEHEHALRSLNRVNRLLGVDGKLADAIRTIAGPGGSVVDVGCGGGGFLGTISEDSNSRPVLAVGVDRSEYALRCAARWQRPGIRCLTADASALPLADRSVDVVTCSLFLHHFDEPGVVAILQEAARVARKAVVVADLVRSGVSLVITWLATRALSRSRVFHVDGPRSVRAAFLRRELLEFAQCAGLTEVTATRCFPFRVILVGRKREPADER